MAKPLADSTKKKILELLAKGLSGGEVSRKLGVSQATVSNVRNAPPAEVIAPAAALATLATMSLADRVEADDGKFLAWAAYSPESQIRLRAWSFDEAERIDGDFFGGASECLDCLHGEHDDGHHDGDRIREGLRRGHIDAAVQGVARVILALEQLVRGRHQYATLRCTGRTHCRHSCSGAP